MKYLLTGLITLSIQLALSQENSTIKTDTSVIETLYHPSFNSISIFNNLKDGSKSYYTELYLDTKKIKEQGIFSARSAVGIWQEFSSEGKLIREIDHDKGVITYFDKKAFPFLELQNAYKSKGDSIIKKIYSAAFLDKHVVWSVSSSYIYNEHESGRWTDELKKRPTKFLLRYNITLDGNIYDDLIEFEIDSLGQLIPNESEDVYGFEQLPENSPRTFQLNRDKAIELARQNGLQENDSTKADAFLHWENLRSSNIYNGRFRFYVRIKTSSIKSIRSDGRSSVTDKFDVYVFNPWTGQFIGKKKMKAIHSWEKMSGADSGLIPDNE